MSINRQSLDHENDVLIPQKTDKKKPGLQCCDKFWLTSAFVNNFTKTLCTTTVTNAVLITDIFNLKPWLLGVSLVAAEISSSLAVLLALSEAYSHYQQNTSFVSAEEDDDRYIGDIALSEVPLTKGQIAAALIHYCGDILEGCAFPLAIRQLLATEPLLPALQVMLEPREVKLAIAAGALVFTALGTYREFKNTLTAAQLNNLRNMPKLREVSIQDNNDLDATAAAKPKPR